MAKDECPFTPDGKHINGCGCHENDTILGLFRRHKRTEKSTDRKDPPEKSTNPKAVCPASDRPWYATHVHLCNHRMEGHPVTHMCYCGHRWT